MSSPLNSTKRLSEKGADPLRRVKKPIKTDSPPKGQTPVPDLGIAEPDGRYRLRLACYPLPLSWS